MRCAIMSSRTRTAGNACERRSRAEQKRDDDDDDCLSVSICSISITGRRPDGIISGISSGISADDGTICCWQRPWRQWPHEGWGAWVARSAAAAALPSTARLLLRRDGGCCHRVIASSDSRQSSHCPRLSFYWHFHYIHVS